ncbi:MAG: phosphoglucosamine mutase, partial [Candidatus Binatota bacterium]|nr:phosphoglucosamine mutase [Candidatus Binatota bacterium]
LTSVGVNVTDAGVIPTPGLAYLTREGRDFVAGVMVTASHNPYEYNGVKVFDAKGGKLSDDIETRLNSLIEEGVADRGQGEANADNKLISSYEDFLVAGAQGLQLGGLTVAIDSANGAASGLAERVFNRLGARVTSLFDAPDGRNINAGCGATDTKALRRAVADNKCDLGIALDGDADRLMMVDGQAREVNGDQLMYVLAVSAGLDGLVATVMSNLGFEMSLQDKGIDLERVDVGDRYVLEGLRRTSFSLGGEQSGHIIFPKLLRTGDGLLAAVRVLRAVSDSKKSLGQWRDEVKLLPQALVNIPLADKSLLGRPEVENFLTRQADKLNDSGRVLIRPSGTEPLARVMVEAPDAQKLAETIAAELKELLTK